MTVRDATRRQSPDDHVLYIEELRKHLGLQTTADNNSHPTRETTSPPEVLLVGHDMHGDFKNLEQEGIDLAKHLHYSGCVDTHVVVEDADATMGKSLGKLMYHYGLAELEFKKPGCSRIQGKWHFKGAHCAGNDAIATLKVILAQSLDRSLTSYTYNDDSTVDVEENIYKPRLDEPPTDINANMILLAYDSETVETPKYKPNVRNRTSEHGFAWLNLRDVASIPPGKNGVGWHPFIQARHWINRDFRTFQNWFFVPGNRDGFWREYGKSRYYCVEESPGVFHELFEELAYAARGVDGEGDGVDEVAGLLEGLGLGERCPRGEELRMEDVNGGVGFEGVEKIGYTGSRPRPSWAQVARKAGSGGGL